MMKLKEAMRIYRRLCKSNKEECSECPLDVFGSLSCFHFIGENPDQAEEILAQWNSEHPAYTNRMKFEEVFGRPTFSDSVCKDCNNIKPCSACDWWDEEYKEPIIK